MNTFGNYWSNSLFCIYFSVIFGKHWNDCSSHPESLRKILINCNNEVNQMMKKIELQWTCKSDSYCSQFRNNLEVQKNKIYGICVDTIIRYWLIQWKSYLWWYRPLKLSIASSGKKLQITAKNVTYVGQNFKPEIPLVPDFATCWKAWPI